MDTNDIVLEIDAEISRLRQARAILSGTSTLVKRKAGRPSGTNLPKAAKARRTMSAEAREKIATAQRARWAKTRKAAKRQQAGAVATATSVKSPAPKGTAVPKKAAAKKANAVKKAGQS
jgi:hypothetical protein